MRRGEEDWVRHSLHFILKSPLIFWGVYNKIRRIDRVLPVGFWVKGQRIAIDQTIVEMAVRAMQAGGGKGGVKQAMRAIRSLVAESVPA